jgi:hypothetical protein
VCIHYVCTNSRCTWMTGCVGCYIAPTDELAGLRDGDTIAVDWHKTVVEERYDVANAAACSIHPR